MHAARYEFVRIAASLLGLALFQRHPDARSTHPRLATGALLLLVQQVMVILTPMLDPLLVAFSRPFVSFGSMLDDPHVRYSPFAQAYRIVITIVGIVGLAYLASGLSAARRNEQPAGMRGVAVYLAILVVAASGAILFGLTLLDLDTTPVLITIGGILEVNGTPVLLALSGISMIVNMISTSVIAYLVLVALAGWIAKEQPRVDWRLAAVGAGLVLLDAVLAPIIGVLPLSPERFVTVIGLVGDAAVIGWVLLVVAFALGLPSTLSIPDDEPEVATPDRPAAMTPGSEAG